MGSTRVSRPPLPSSAPRARSDDPSQASPRRSSRSSQPSPSRGPSTTRPRRSCLGRRTPRRCMIMMRRRSEPSGAIIPPPLRRSMLFSKHTLRLSYRDFCEWLACVFLCFIFCVQPLLRLAFPVAQQRESTPQISIVTSARERSCAARRRELVFLLPNAFRTRLELTHQQPYSQNGTSWPSALINGYRELTPWCVSRSPSSLAADPGELPTTHCAVRCSTEARVQHHRQGIPVRPLPLRRHPTPTRRAVPLWRLSTGPRQASPEGWE